MMNNDVKEYNGEYFLILEDDITFNNIKFIKSFWFPVNNNMNYYKNPDELSEEFLFKSLKYNI